MGTTATKSRMQELLTQGQSIWFDYLRRGMVRGGELKALVDDGLRGVTSNPTIFEHAIGGSADYDLAMGPFQAFQTNAEVFEALAVEDVRAAADVLRPVYDESKGADGFVSLEVSPTLARNTEGTVTEARRLWSAVDRPNVMIKVPGTKEGWPAIERLLVEGVNINVTLLFSLEHYQEVAKAYVRALETRAKAGRAVDRIASVASFFVSRVDSEADKRIDAKDDAGLKALKGKIAIANAQLAYTWFVDQLKSPAWKKLAGLGAKPQRLLWASTGTKNPEYSDVIYVDSMIAPHTVNTLPPATLKLFEDHGAVKRTLTDAAGDAPKVMSALAKGGVDFADVTRFLEEDGIDKFAKSFETLLKVIGDKRKALAKNAAPRHSAELRSFDAQVARRLDQLEQAAVIKKIWTKDPTAWKDDPKTPEITNRLGWLEVGAAMAQQAEALTRFADEVRKKFDRVVLCGMGGSSLAPEVLLRTFGTKDKYPKLIVLDSTDPRAIAAADQGNIKKTLFIISSKSGTTQEPKSFFSHYWELTGGNGDQFIAITDPDTALSKLAAEKKFRRCFINPADIGGRYSALSYFGLVPAALIGVDVGGLLHRAHRMAESCAAFVPTYQNPAAWLGAILGEGAMAGRDKATFVLSPGIASFGLWAEQLIAESTGKEGKGVLPVAEEPLGAPGVYGNDRIFISIALAAEQSADVDQNLAALAKEGHPVVRLVLDDRLDLGQEFFRWEMATAVVGSVLRINAFDQPNVAESKKNTEAVLSKKQPPSPAASKDDIEKFLGGIKPGDYLAIMAYLPPTLDNDRRLAAIRLKLRDRLKVATTLGYGPRFLHSTGQLHKGGRAIGHFLQITEQVVKDIPIPDEKFTFGELEAAQAEGDLQALRGRKRPAIRVAGLAALEK
jgi:transaldolase/glucose-6-phosphate isomerase